MNIIFRFVGLFSPSRRGRPRPHSRIVGFRVRARLIILEKKRRFVLLSRIIHGDRIHRNTDSTVIRFLEYTTRVFAVFFSHYLIKYDARVSYGFEPRAFRVHTYFLIYCHLVVCTFFFSFSMRFFSDFRPIKRRILYGTTIQPEITTVFNAFVVKLPTDYDKCDQR